METHLCGDTLVLRWQAPRLDARNASLLRTELTRAVAAGHQRIVLNLELATFIDSSGLGAIVAARRALGTEGAIVLCGLTDATSPILRLTRMDRVFEIHATEAEALAV